MIKGAIKGSEGAQGADRGLRIDALSLSIHGTPILRDVSLSLMPGRVLGLVGESGSGKSLTAQCILQLLPNGSSVSGEVSFEGRSLLDLSEAQLCALRGRRISMIFQEPMTALNPVQTIGDQVAETLLVHGITGRAAAYDIAQERLERVGLDRKAVPPTRYPHELSGGQRQRVCIAMAIACKPALLIADEPTTALDVTTQAQILDLLRELVAEEQMSLLLITHDLAVVAGMADDVAVMRAGAVVEQGPAGDVFARMRHPYTRALFAASAHQPVRTPVKARAASCDTGAVLLRLDNVQRSYDLPRRGWFGRGGTLRAVDGVSFGLDRAQSLGLVGESGCGKSTLSRAILGLEPVQGGRIALDGVPVGADMPPGMRQRMQVVFQDPYGSFNPRHRVERILKEPFYLGGTPADLDERIAQTLTSVGLNTADARKYPHEFSGGQRQRIAIARALITRPDLIVLDEAVSALDVSVRAVILDLLADLQAQFGLSYLFISHDLNVVRAITDRVMVMQAGRIVEQGATKDVFARPAHAYTRALLAASPRLPDTAALTRPEKD
jgi:peptide/nickel transport system ATP-binding protein